MDITNIIIILFVIILIVLTIVLLARKSKSGSSGSSDSSGSPEPSPEPSPDSSGPYPLPPVVDNYKYSCIKGRCQNTSDGPYKGVQACIKDCVNTEHIPKSDGFEGCVATTYDPMLMDGGITPEIFKTVPKWFHPHTLDWDWEEFSPIGLALLIMLVVKQQMIRTRSLRDRMMD